MRILGVGDACELGDMYWRLARAGHEVRVYVGSPAARDVCAGMLTRTPDWRAELDWVRGAGADGLVIFETATHGEWQDALRRDGFRVIGGSAFGDRLEGDRAFGQQVLREAGLRIARSHGFRDFGSAMAFLRASPGRYVFKLNGADSVRMRNYIGQRADGADMLKMLSLLGAQWQREQPPDFVLMEHLEGVEVGVGAYFDGRDFLSPALVDWEHKRFFTGDLGELTGEMGTIVSYRGASRLFAATLSRVTEHLREGGYCGYINLNLIANEEGLWPLEFTSRFGYPGFAICDALHVDGWDIILRRMLGDGPRTFRTHAGFAAGVVLSVPPFPYAWGYETLSKGVPLILDALDETERDAWHPAEVEMRDGEFLASGSTGYLGVVTGRGHTLREACDAAYAVASKVVVPNLRYRTDIGAKLMRGDYARLAEWGYLD